MRVAVIGGTGLIGTASADALVAAGHGVTLVSRHPPGPAENGTSWVRGDIGEAAAIRAALAEIRPDAVLHLAAYLQFACEQNPAEAIRVNVDGTLNVLEACRELAIRRFVFGGSIASYGERADLMREEDPPVAATGLYGMTKRLGEMLGSRYAALHGLTFVSLRYGGVFGPVEVKSAGMALVRQRIKETARGKDVVVEGANGSERFHLTHVNDAAGATVAAITHPKPAHQVYNVAGPPGNYMSLEEMHAAVRRLVPDAGKAIFSGRARSAGPVDTTRLREDLGFAPAVSVEAGLAFDLRSMVRG
jgi:nucleoside-diphosphate-sugar epimerase